MKHFTCLTTSYPQDAHPLAGRFVQSLHRAYQYAGWSSKVITLDRGCTQRGPHDTRQSSRQIGALGEEIFLSKTWGESVKGGAPDKISAHPLSSLGAMPINTWRLNRAYHNVLQRYPKLQRAPCVAHWALPCGWLTRKRRPLIYCHGGDVALLERLPLGALLSRQLLKHARGIVCVSEDLKRRLIDLSGAASTPHQEKLHTLPMGIDTPEPSPEHLTRYRALGQHKLIIATIGRFSEIKGYQILVESLGALTSEERARIVWIAGGDGPELSGVQRRAQLLQVPLITEGLISPPQRDALYQACDLFIAPSCRVDRRVEGMPLALREAALSGCQVMATALGGVCEVIRQLPPDAVIEIEPNISSITSALQAWLRIDQRVQRDHLSPEMSAVAKARWSWDSLGPQHLTLFERLHSTDRR